MQDGVLHHPEPGDVQCRQHCLLSPMTALSPTPVLSTFAEKSGDSTTFIFQRSAENRPQALF